MRKSVCLLFLSVLLICLMMPIHYSEAASWEEVYSTESESYYVDSSSVRKDKKQHYHYWVKASYDNEASRKEEINSLKEIFPKVDFSKLAYEVIQEEAYTNSNGSYFRDVLTYYYDADGNAIGVWDTHDFGWNTIAPESLGLEIYTKAKSYAKKK